MGNAQTINEDDNIPPPLRKKFLNKIYSNGYKIERLLSRLILWNRFEMVAINCRLVGSILETYKGGCLID